MDRYSERAARPTLNTAERKEETLTKEPVAARAFSPHTAEKGKKKFTKQALIGAVGLVVLLALAWWFFLRNIGIPSYIDTGKYQVACLQSGECYFGKVTSVTSDTVLMKNVFYVQKSTTTGDATSTDENNLQLIKLGNEVHGPEDMMAINRAQVLYIENLKTDGKVAQTIKSYYDQNKQ